MSRNPGSLLGSPEKRGTRPAHPDTRRWLCSLLSSCVVLASFTAAPVLAALMSVSQSMNRYVLDHAPVMNLALAGLDYLALGILVLVLIDACRTLRRWRRWSTYIRQLEGNYWGITAPKPKGSVSSTNTSPSAPLAMWDRIAAIVNAAPGQAGTGMPIHIAAELWGQQDMNGVQWGFWLPSGFETERVALRQLVTADRPQARIVQTPDPLHRAFQRDETNPGDDGVRWYGTTVLTVAAPDYYPLAEDGLMMSSIVAALRAPRDVLASSVALIIEPAPAGWARRVDQLVQRRRWIARYDGRFDDQYKQQADMIAVKSQEAHVAGCIRIQVIARTEAAVRRELAQIEKSITSSHRRYKHTLLNITQRWKRARRIQVVPISAVTDIPPAGRGRAPLGPQPTIFPFFPFT